MKQQRRLMMLSVDSNRDEKMSGYNRHELFSCSVWPGKWNINHVQAMHLSFYQLRVLIRHPTHLRSRCSNGMKKIPVGKLNVRLILPINKGRQLKGIHSPDSWLTGCRKYHINYQLPLCNGNCVQRPRILRAGQTISAHHYLFAFNYFVSRWVLPTNSEICTCYDE